MKFTQFVAFDYAMFSNFICIFLSEYFNPFAITVLDQGDKF